MGIYKPKLNPFSGKMQVVWDASLLTIKGTVENASELPLSGNTNGDSYVVTSLDRIYTWNNTESSGLITDWIDIASTSAITWSAITGKPTSSVEDIDDAVDKKHDQNSDTKLDEGGANEISALQIKTDSTKLSTIEDNATADQTNLEIQEAAKLDVDIADAISKKHTHNTDTILDEGGANEISALEIKNAIDSLESETSNNNFYSVDDISTQGTIYYVSLDGNDSNDGLNKQNSFLTIQHAIDESTDGDTILVYEGTYEISQEITCNKGINLIGLYGAEKTIIQPTDGTQIRCLYIYETKTAVVRGFTFQNGHTILGGTDINPGNGGGVCIWQDTGSSPSTDVGSYIIDCIIKDCYANQYGGGVHLNDHKSAIINSKVYNCSTAISGFNSGGGISLRWEGYARNCLVYNCNAVYGSGILCYNGICQVHNCTVVDNLSSGIALYGGSGSGHQIYNSIVYYNSSNFAILGGAYDIKHTNSSPAQSGTNNTNIVPSFLDRDNDNYKLIEDTELTDIGMAISWHDLFNDIDGKNSRYIKTLGAYIVDSSIFAKYIFKNKKSSEIDNDSSIAGATVKDALDNLENAVTSSADGDWKKVTMIQYNPVTEKFKVVYET